MVVVVRCDDRWARCFGWIMVPRAFCYFIGLAEVLTIFPPQLLNKNCLAKLLVFDFSFMQFLEGAVGFLHAFSVSLCIVLEVNVGSCNVFPSACKLFCIVTLGEMVHVGAQHTRSVWLCLTNIALFSFVVRDTSWQRRCHGLEAGVFGDS